MSKKLTSNEILGKTLMINGMTVGLITAISDDQKKYLTDERAKLQAELDADALLPDED